MEKKSYLVNQYLKNYLSASIATMAIMNLNGLVDGVLMGRLLGTDALAAINLSLPLLNVLGSIGMLLGGGASIVAAKALSTQDYERASLSFTAAVSSLLFFGVLVGLLSLVLAEPIAEILCVTPELLELSVSYISMLMVGSFFIVSSSSLMQLVDVAGNPKMVTKAAFVSAVANVLMDIFLVGVLGVGIGGAAMATAIASFCSIVLLLTYIKSDKSPYRLMWNISGIVDSFKKNFIQGIPGVVSSATFTILIFTCNHYVQLAQGADGMFVMSVGIIIMSLSFMLVGGSSAAFVAIGSMLLGRNDYKGLKMLYKRGFLLGMSSAVISAVLSVGGPRYLAMLFGADSEHIFELAASNLPLMSFFICALCINMYMATVYQVLGKLFLCMPTVISAPVLACLFQVLIANFVSLDYIWYAFVLSGILSLFIVLLISELARKKSEHELMFFSLLPIGNGGDMELNASIPCTKAGVGEEITKLFEMCDKAGLGEVGNKIVLCLEELSLTIVEHSNRGESSFIDVYIIIEDKEIRAYLQDNGIAFDPVNVAAEERSVSLKLLHNYCKDMKYNYSFGQNVTHMKWVRQQ